MWKSVRLELGKDEELDAPNDNLFIAVIPLMWLPGKTSTEIMTRLQADEEAVTKLEAEGRNTEVMDVRLEGMYAVLPHLIGAWNLKDPNTLMDIPIPSKLFAAGQIDVIRGLPMQLLTKAVNTSIEYGTKPEDLAAPVAVRDSMSVVNQDPDEGDSAAQAIPFASVTASAALSSPDQVQTS